MKQEKDIEIKNNTFMKFTEKEIYMLQYAIRRLIEDSDSFSKKDIDEHEKLYAKLSIYSDEINEHIDEEELNKIADKYEKEQREKWGRYNIDFDSSDIEKAYKAGYRKAKEE